MQKIQFLYIEGAAQNQLKDIKLAEESNLIMNYTKPLKRSSMII